MAPTKIPDPIPREIELPYTEFIYPVIRKDYLERPDERLDKGFLEVLHSRRTRRIYGDLQRSQLSALLWHTARTRGCAREESGFLWQHRSTPSGGGRHPIDILVLHRAFHEQGLAVYDPWSHALCDLRFEPAVLHSFVNRVDNVLPIGDATILWFLAQNGRTLSKYENGESLIWRDSGALLATMYLVAESLDLNCCGVGITGDPLVTNLVSATSEMQGIGGCLIGSRDEE